MPRDVNAENPDGEETRQRERTSETRETSMRPTNTDDPPVTTDPAALRDARLGLCSDVRFRRVADEAVIIRQDAGEVLVVNELGARVLEMLEGPGAVSYDELVDRLSREYEQAESLPSDILEFLVELVDSGVAASRAAGDS